MTETRTTSTENLTAKWRGLGASAGTGFSFDHESARAAAMACKELAANIQKAKDNLMKIDRIRGFGSFNSSMEAVGLYQTQYTRMSKQLAACTEIAQIMEQAFTAADTSIDHTEGGNATNISSKRPT